MEESVRRDSLDAELHFALAGRYWALKRYDDVERELRFAVAIDGRHARALLALSLLPYARRPKLGEELQRGRVPEEWREPLEESRRQVRRAFLIDPLAELNEDSPQFGYWFPGGGGRRAIQARLDLGIQAFNAGQYSIAYNALSDYARRAFPGRERDSLPEFLLLYRGIAAAHMGLYLEAIGDVYGLVQRGERREQTDSLIRIPLQTNDYRYLLAVIEERAARVSDAAVFYREAAANDLGLYMAHVRLAQIHRHARQWPDAVAEGRLAVAGNPDDATSLLELAEIYEESNRLAEAEEALQRALVANPRDARIPYRLGRLELLVGNAEAGRTALERFVAIAPRRYDRELIEARKWLSEARKVQ